MAWGEMPQETFAWCIKNKPLPLWFVVSCVRFLLHGVLLCVYLFHIFLMYLFVLGEVRKWFHDFSILH